MSLGLLLVTTSTWVLGRVTFGKDLTNDANTLTGPQPMEMNNFLERDLLLENVEGTLEYLKTVEQRLGHQHEADLDVVLTSSPLLSPDVLVHTPNLPGSPDHGLLTNQTAKTNRYQIFGVASRFLPEVEQLFDSASSSGDLEILTKLNASQGGFNFNFGQDAKFLVVSPVASSRLVLTCDEVNLGNCSMAGDTLVVNNVGDLKFGRNSFIYCGSGVKVRVASLRRSISIRIRRDLKVGGEMECKFFTRKQRFFDGDENSCGKLRETRSGSRIVGGRRVAPGLFPYLAQLDMTKSSGLHTTCSGSLISDTWVLTAAHCLRGVEGISVYLGGTDRKEFTGREMIVQAEKFILHKDWNAKTLLGDIALVKLSKRIKPTNEVSPVCLPDRKLRNENLLGKKGVAVGWGRLSTTERAPRQAYRVKLPFLSDLRCFLNYPRFFRPKVMMCTESSEERAICYGDSGGPLLYLRNQRVYQVGISSYSSSPTCGESFDVFTRLDDNYVDWIRKRIQE